MAYPRFQRARNFKEAQKSTDTLLGNTNWGAVDSAVDRTISAQVGDIIEVIFSASISDTAANAAEVETVTMNGVTPINSMWNRTTAPSGASGAGFPAWAVPSGVMTRLIGSLFYPVVAADIVNGLVSIQLRFRTGLATPTRSLTPFSIAYKNLGPVDPN